MFESFSILGLAILFAAAGLGIGVVGVPMTRMAATLAERTGLGQLLMGAVFVGGTTSLSGIATSVTAALNGDAALAVSNAVGGIAAQTLFLAAADVAYRHANLEHAAASAENLTMAGLLLFLLGLPLAALSFPTLAFWAIHPITIVLIVAYLFGLRLVSRAARAPMWHPKRTGIHERRPDSVGWAERTPTTQLWVLFAASGASIAVLGWSLGEAGGVLAERTGISQTVVGALMTAVLTSLPELVTAIVAVRMGALSLAVGDVIGGNAFDTLLIALSDLSYRGGSIYAAIGPAQQFQIVLTILMTAVLLLGLLQREKHGPGNIGGESTLIVALYVAASVALFYL